MKYKEHLIDFHEFATGDAETTEYEAPYAAVILAKDDKIWHFFKNVF